MIPRDEMITEPSGLESPALRVANCLDEPHRVVMVLADVKLDFYLRQREKLFVITLNSFMESTAWPTQVSHD